MPKRDQITGERTEMEISVRSQETPQGPALLFNFTSLQDPDGVQWLLPLDTLAQFLLHEYENLERYVIYRFYGEGDRVLEAGTGLGITGLTILRSGAELVTYDPKIENMRLAAQIFKFNGFDKVYLAAAAIASKTGEVTLVTDRIGWDATILDRQVEFPMDERRVPCVDVNDALKDHKCNALHLDVEGAEVDIIEVLDLSLISKFSLEVHPSMIGEESYDGIIVKKLTEAGYELVTESGKKRNYPTHNWVEAWERI
jgi:FkbM family methyltransferase